MQRSKIVKRVFKSLLFIAIFIILMVILDATFELDETRTEDMLIRYSNTGKIETVFVGNSVGEMLDDGMYTSLSGEPSFNMCTPSQGLSVSLKNIELAFSHHKIKKAVLLMSTDMINSEDYEAIDALYARTVDSSSPFSTRIKNAVKRNMEKSFAYSDINSNKVINIWIPWENENIHGFANVMGNIKRRWMRLINRQPLGYRIAFDLNVKKYDPADEDETDEDRELLNEDIQRLENLPIPGDMVTADKMAVLADMCRFCRDNGIELVVIITPHRTDYYDRYEAFRTFSDEADRYLGGFITERGFKFHNCEDDPSVHEILPDNYFYDWEHISHGYEDKATTYLYDVISMY